MFSQDSWKTGGMIYIERLSKYKSPKIFSLQILPSPHVSVFFQGGKEHGVPILISEIHCSMPADRCRGLYVGDAILVVNGMDLQEAKHAEAVKILSSVHGEITMEVLYVAPDDSSDEEEGSWEDDEGRRWVVQINPKSASALLTDKVRGCSGGQVVSTLASYQCSLGSIPSWGSDPGAISFKGCIPV